MKSSRGHRGFEVPIGPGLGEVGGTRVGLYGPGYPIRVEQ